jgi:hypothetical protein
LRGVDPGLSGPRMVMECAVLVLLRSSAPVAGRARRRRSGSTSVRDNLAHLVDDETQHDHARYDGADDGAAAQAAARVGPV